MNRRLLVAVLSLAVTTPILAQEAVRPAVRISGVRAADEGVTQARAQSPDTTPKAMPTGTALPNPQAFTGAPSVMETRGAVAPGAIPPPMIPGAYQVYPGTPIATGGPIATGVTMGPAMPMQAQPMPGQPMPGQPIPMATADGGLFGASPDAPLFGGVCPSVNSVNNKFWFGVEYLSWRTEGQNLPVLVSTGPAASNGILGQSGTQVLFGGGQADSVRQNGARFTTGYWFGCNQCWGIDASYFFLSPNTQSFATNSTAFPLLARPFTNLNQNIPFSQLTAYPGVATGAISVTQESSMQGADVNLRKRWAGTGCFRLDGLLGFRYIDFEETLTIGESFARTPNSPPSIGVPNAVSGVVTDQFSTTNKFYGGQLGLQSEWRRGRWFLQGTAKVGLGTMEETLSVNGGQTLTLTNGTTQSTSGGLLALQGANIGSYSQNKFAVVPEFGLNLGYHITPHWRVFVGYNLLYLNTVLRPADQIDTGLDVTRIPNFPVTGVTRLNTVRPTVTLKDTTLTTQGITFGTSFQW
ncbi:hypothetical protein BH11PLA2_BH11PLA2_23830 [soil metagenome]